MLTPIVLMRVPVHHIAKANHANQPTQHIWSVHSGGDVLHDETFCVYANDYPDSAAVFTGWIGGDLTKTPSWQTADGKIQFAAPAANSGWLGCQSMKQLYGDNSIDSIYIAFHISDDETHDTCGAGIRACMTFPTAAQWPAVHGANSSNALDYRWAEIL